MSLFENPGGGLAPIDWIIVALYALGTILLGSYYSRRQTSLEEYFTGGGKMNPTLIGVSLMATSLSSIGYLSIPGEAIAKGPVGLANMLAHPFIFVVVGFMFGLFFFAFFVPFARPLGVAAGAVCGLATAVLLAYSGPIFGRDPVTGTDPVSFMWIAPAALVVNLTAGTLISYGLHVSQKSPKGE